MARRTTDTHIDMGRLMRLPSPKEVKRLSPSSTQIDKQVYAHRRVIEGILKGSDKRMISITGPCSIHDPAAAIEYAKRLAALSKEVSDRVFIVMRLYFQKPRTTTGWKGMFYDPHFTMNGGDVEKGAKLVREIALEVAKLGLPIATETLDQWMIQFIDDLVSWCCIGARTVESQPHRELASGLSTPVGMKNPTDGNPRGAINAIKSANHPHSFFGMDEDGRLAVFPTEGNPYAHLVLRGGISAEHSFSNYHEDSVRSSIAELKKQDLLASVIVDAAHENMIDPATGQKDFRRQTVVVNDLLRQRLAGNEKIVGFMVESNLVEGSQKLPDNGDRTSLVYGRSITDPCINIRDTEKLHRFVRDKLQAEATH